MINKKSAWETVELSADNSKEACMLLPKLINNEIAAIMIKRFLSDEELVIIKENIKNKSIKWYSGKENEQGRVGINATGFSHLTNGKEKYFEAVSAAEDDRDEIFKKTTNPIDKILNFFNYGYSTRIATESEFGGANYFTGLIRAMGARSTLHFDYAPKQLLGWDVANEGEQFGLVLYLQMPAIGGELNIYNHPWTPEDDVYNNDHIEKGTFGFTEGFLGDAPYASVLPQEGDLIVFRTRNFHQVGQIKSDKPRLGLTTFMSFKDDVLTLWS
jgi:hypothetical protein